VLADSEREAVADLLGFLENVLLLASSITTHRTDSSQRAETDFFCGEPLRALSTLVYSDNIDLQRSASLTFAEITERGTCPDSPAMGTSDNSWVDVREVDRDTLEPILFLLQNPDIEVQRAASAALGNLAVNSTCTPRITKAHTDPHSGEQGGHCRTRRARAVDQADELA
jgi:vacuolar protein 8